ncbi:MAG: hypothetical protein WC796_05320 [Candidatus Pacearchaeota archaeon]|jgi:hypothetical protein
MKKLLAVVVLATLVLGVLPAVFATSIGSGVGVNIQTEKFPPQVWMCGARIVADDATEPGRISTDGQELIERINNYAFEGESVTWTVLVMDKNGINKVKDVFATIGDSQGAGNNIEVNCREDLSRQGIDESCNARIQEEYITQFDSAIMRYYTCTLTVETPESMYGEYWTTVEAVDLDDQSGVAAENEYWFFNPVVALKIDGEMSFENARPGADSYSKTMLVGNDADAGSGVMLDMFISGTDFYDSSSSGAMCPTTNQLALSNFRYFATSGAYSTKQDAEVGRNCDVEGYCSINYGIGFNDPNPFYNSAEIIQAQPVGPYYTANVLAPGAEMALTFKLSLPEPCNGDFDSGKIYFWGEAI